MKKIFITGITGFAGSFLAEYLLSQGDVAISGTYLDDHSLQNITSIQSNIDLHKVNLLNATDIDALIAKIKPDHIYHLAALTSPGDSFTNPSEFITSNIIVELNILEAIRKNNLLQARIMIAASSDEYGLVSSEDLPIDENTPLRPTNPYAVSKIAQDFLGLQYYLSYKLQILRVRPFNHIGPRQSPKFAVSSFAKKIADIEKGKNSSVLTVGNLESKRDFTDVLDMVKAYSLVVDQGASGEVYNIGSGVSWKMADIVKKLISFSTVPITVEVDPDLMRPSDIPDIVCDNKKVTELTGWKPQISVEKSLENILNYWRKQN